MKVKLNYFSEKTQRPVQWGSTYDLSVEQERQGLAEITAEHMRYHPELIFFYTFDEPSTDIWEGEGMSVPQTFDPSDLKHGLYKIYWVSGGSSLASVGSYCSGQRWMAPTNWVSGESDDWSGVLYAERIDV